MLGEVDIGGWLQRTQALTLSRELLLSLVLQIGLIAAASALALVIRLASRAATDRMFERLEPYWRTGRLGSLRRLVIPSYTWLLLLLAGRVGAQFALDLRLVGIAATLTLLWIVLQASTTLFRDALLARLVAVVAWIVAALDVTGLLPPTAAALDSAALTFGAVRLSLLMVVKAVLLIAVLLWGALALARLIGARIQRLSLSPSVQALTHNLATIVLVSLALLIGLSMVGIDLTALTVFSGAVGVGLGFGLQKIVSNFVSGIILLLERSIKPGDVIEVGQTYGVVNSVGARYVSVHGRDGKVYMIPNETLITNQVVNWSGGSPLLRLDVAFTVAFGSDLHEVRRLAIEAARQTGRVATEPAPVCHISEFGDEAVNLLLRFWIRDPANGVRNVKGEVYLALWQMFHEHGIAFPSPARDIVIREVPAELTRAARTRSAAE